MKHKKLPKILIIVFFLLILVSLGSALAGSNSIPVTHIEDHTGPTPHPNDIKPVECNPIYVDEITSGSGVINGTRSNNLILGSSSDDTINASNAGNKWLTNCILGGAGNDEINGSKKDEIILGGPGNDVIDGGKGYDICYGNGGNDTFINCEEEYQ